MCNFEMCLLATKRTLRSHLILRNLSPLRHQTTVSVKALSSMLEVCCPGSVSFDAVGWQHVRLLCTHAFRVSCMMMVVGWCIFRLMVTVWHGNEGQTARNVSRTQISESRVTTSRRHVAIWDCISFHAWRQHKQVHCTGSKHKPFEDDLSWLILLLYF